MTPERLNELEAACEAATPDWQRDGMIIWVVVAETGKTWVAQGDEGDGYYEPTMEAAQEQIGEFGTEEDARFAVVSRAALPECLAEIRRLTACTVSSAEFVDQLDARRE